MYGQLKGVVDTLISGFSSVREFKSKRDREKSILDMLAFYFLLKDCIDDGERLILEAGSTPVAKVTAMSLQEADSVVSRWTRVLALQADRLYRLEGLLFTQHALAVINPSLAERLNDLIGYKMSRSVTLHGIGASLVVGCMVYSDKAKMDMVRMIPCMAGERSRVRINMARVRREVADLRGALDEYRRCVQSLATNAEIVKLSKKARDMTHPVSRDTALR